MILENGFVPVTVQWQRMAAGAVPRAHRFNVSGSLLSGMGVKRVSEKNSRAAANQKRNKHGHRCISCDRAAIELLREKSQIRFMMNCMLAILPCVRKG